VDYHSIAVSLFTIKAAIVSVEFTSKTGGQTLPFLDAKSLRDCFKIYVARRSSRTLLREVRTPLVERRYKLRVSITQAHPAYCLKQQQLGEADVSAPQFDLFFYRRDPSGMLWRADNEPRRGRATIADDRHSLYELDQSHSKLTWQPP
jgi:hypothetical protein